MAATPASLLLLVHAPALTGGDARPLAVVRAMESALPGLRLAWTISDDGKFISLPHRDDWLARETPDGGLPLLCNGDERALVTLTGWESPAGISSGGLAQFEVHAKLPLNTVDLAAAARLLEAVADSAQAWWGHATPRLAAGDIADQTSDPVRKPQVPPRGLPALKLSEDIHSPEIPHCLGWLNYWSAATARVLGFPDPARDADLLSRAQRTATGGWVVPLTQDPLELDRPAHLDALLRAYERFPAVGGRSRPP